MKERLIGIARASALAIVEVGIPIVLSDPNWNVGKRRIRRQRSVYALKARNKAGNGAEDLRVLSPIDTKDG